jgi:hypothetical protein
MRKSASVADDLGKMNILQGVIKILEAGNIKTVVDLSHSHGTFGAYYFRALRYPKGRLTVELRQHEGTLAPHRITAWIRTLVGIIKFVENTSDDAFLRLLVAGIRNDTEEKHKSGGFSVVSLLRMIGLPDSVMYYQDKLHLHNIFPEEESV